MLIKDLKAGDILEDYYDCYHSIPILIINVKSYISTSKEQLTELKWLDNKGEIIFHKFYQNRTLISACIRRITC